jgi:fluoride exporter
MARFLWICLGGAAGTGARYLLSLRLGGLAWAFPVATFVVNVLGSFLIGVLIALGTTTTMMSPTTRLALTTGVMGGFTTYSTFSYETVRLIESGAWGLATLNVVGTTCLCIGGCLLGSRTVGWIT